MAMWLLLCDTDSQTLMIQIGCDCQPATDLEHSGWVFVVQKLLRRKKLNEILSSKPSAVVTASSSPTYCESGTPSETTPGDADAESKPQSVQLIGDVLCSFTLLVLIALQFKGVFVDATWLTPGDLTDLKILNVSPKGKYPVLQYAHHKLHVTLYEFCSMAQVHPNLPVVQA